MVPEFLEIIAVKSETPLFWENEASVQILVVDVLNDIIRMIDLEYQMKVTSELTFQSARCDIWILTIQGMPVGVVFYKETLDSRLRFCAR